MQKTSASSPGPPNVSVNPPSPIPLAALDQSFVLQIMLDLKASVAVLKESSDNLKEQSKEQGRKLDKISHQVYAALVVLILIGGILGFFAKGINDIIVHRLEASPSFQQNPPAHP